MHKISKYRKRVRKILRKPVDLIFPLRCPVCDRPVPFPELICPECRKKLRYVAGPRCLKCGKHIRDDRQEYCRGCRTAPHKFEAGRGIFVYRSAAESMYRFKYAKRQEYARFYGQQIAEKAGGIIKKWKPDALVPVPIHSTKKRERGYNQAALLAEETGRILNIPVESRLLLRVKKTLPQKALSDDERQNNLKKAFKISRNDVKLKTVIIIDDIYTTGSTIDACAETLKEAGVEKVYFITAAIVEELL